MGENLVIVESPAKAKTIEKFLGKDFVVKSSYGHIRDLKPKDFSIDVANNFEPQYEIPADKKKLVSELKDLATKAKMVWLASDEDREGEAISWHLFQALNLKPENTKRIVFHEITKEAILHAIQNPRAIDQNLVDAQQARRVLDRIVGFEVSPILWRKVKPALSAGRVQSVAVKLIVDREREIEQFNGESWYRTISPFNVVGTDGREAVLKAELSKKFNTKEETIAFLESIKGKTFTINDIAVKPARKTPQPPFTTSTLQQEASRKLGFTVAQTMMVAQKLYESGKITYMRTDSVNLSQMAINTAKSEIISMAGERYSKSRQFTTSSKGAQEAHEAIRPTYISAHEIDGTSQEKRLYELIWKRTVASQMADAELERTTISIGFGNPDIWFAATGEVIKFDGFLKLYIESTDDEQNDDETTLIPPLKVGQNPEFVQAIATQRFSQKPYRYNEASLVRKLEELGIGRPSTYAPTISTIQQREYVLKESRPGEPREFAELTLTKNGAITEKNKIENTGQEKNKLFPTDIGSVVCDFLSDHFKNIMSYDFTAKVEEEFDIIAEGKMEWQKTIGEFYTGFHNEVVSANNERTEQKVGERILGVHPETKHQVSVKIGRFGPMVQIGTADDEDKPRFASLLKGQSINTITLEEALTLFKLPRVVGVYNGTEIKANTGRFGPYVQFAKLFVSLTKEDDPFTVSLERAIELIEKKQEAEKQKVIKTFAGDETIQVLNGRYGPYIAKERSNYKIPKGKVPADLTLEECLEIIASQPDAKPSRKAPAKATSKTKATAKAKAKTPAKAKGKPATKKES